MTHSPARHWQWLVPLAALVALTCAAAAFAAELTSRRELDTRDRQLVHAENL